MLCLKSLYNAMFGVQRINILTLYLIETPPLNTFANRVGPDQAALVISLHESLYIIIIVGGA